MAERDERAVLQGVKQTCATDGRAARKSQTQPPERSVIDRHAHAGRAWAGEGIVAVMSAFGLAVAACAGMRTAGCVQSPWCDTPALTVLFRLWPGPCVRARVLFAGMRS